MRGTRTTIDLHEEEKLPVWRRKVKGQLVLTQVLVVGVDIQEEKVDANEECQLVRVSVTRLDADEVTGCGIMSASYTSCGPRSVLNKRSLDKGKRASLNGWLIT